MTGTTTTDNDPSARHRLPYAVEPLRYELHLRPDLQAFTFTGTVAIDALAHEAFRTVELHAQDLTLSSVKITSGPGNPRSALVSPSTGHEDRVMLQLEDGDLPPGPLRIEASFSGLLNQQLCGFYRSTYVDDDGRDHTIATTQFEATDARRAFPCFDEPDRKAVFSVTLDVPPGQSAFSNGPQVSEEDLGDGWRRIRFGDTIAMSTYLVAFVVGPLVASAPVDVDGTPVRVVHVPGREKLTGFALEIAAHSLRFFSEWFGIPYPGEKLDLVAIPDFAFGAMENLGCVTFRETALLVDVERSSRLELERVADVVAHEIAHMWFGDLVTMKWWNGIWLNEAFATLMEMLCVDDFRPDWQRWVSFGIDRQAALDTDALNSTRPVEYPVGSPDEAQGMFDVLTYQKGAAVLRMLELYLGEDKFRSGIRLYLATHRLANSDTADLWDAIEQASGAPVRQIMDSWILQGGFPLVTATRAGDELVLRQEPCRLAARGATSAIGSSWQIPLSIRMIGDPGDIPGQDATLLLEDAPLSIDCEPGRPTLVNARSAGFLRVAYDDQTLGSLVPAVPGLDTLERFGLLADTWTHVLTGRAQLDRFLQLGEQLRHDDDPEVWAQVTGPLAFLDHVAPEPARAVVALYVRALCRERFDALGWQRRPEEADRTSTLRAQLLRTLGTTGADEDVRERCLHMHASSAPGDADIDPELLPAVVAVVARAGGATEFDTLLARFRSSATPQEEIRYLYSLAGFEDHSLALRAYEVATKEARTQNTPFLLQTLLANRANGMSIWKLLTAQWDELVSRLPALVVPRIFDSVKLLCHDAEQADEVRTFIADHPLPSGQRSIDQAVERLGINVAFTARVAPTVASVIAAATERLARG